MGEQLKINPISLASSLLIAAVFGGCGGDDAGFRVINPVAGEAMLVGGITSIEWDAGASSAASVDLLLAFDDGTTRVIAEDVPNSGLYSWTVPALGSASSNRGAIQVVEAGAGSARQASQRERTATGIQRYAIEGEVDVAVGSLAALRWNQEASLEEYYWIDTTDGSSDVRGAVGDLETLDAFAPAAADNQAGRVYVLGNNSESDSKIYALDSVTGELVGDVVIPEGLNASVTGVLPDGDILGFRWNSNDSVEEMIALDPSTGTVGVRGTVGDLETWSTESAVDATANRVYVFGMPAAGPSKIYSIDTVSGEPVASPELTLGGEPLGSPPVGVAVNGVGEVVGFRWNPAEEVEEMLRVDPETGETTVIGAVDDLRVWSTVTALNNTNDEIYVIGSNSDVGAPDSDFLYVMDASTGAFLYKVPVVDYPTSALFVY